MTDAIKKAKQINEMEAAIQAQLEGVKITVGGETYDLDGALFALVQLVGVADQKAQAKSQLLGNYRSIGGYVRTATFATPEEREQRIKNMTAAIEAEAEAEWERKALEKARAERDKGKSKGK